MIDETDLSTFRVGFDVFCIISQNGFEIKMVN